MLIKLRKDKVLVVLQNMKLLTVLAIVLLSGLTARTQPFVLKADAYRHYIEKFNQSDNEIYEGAISNKQSWAFLENNIPFLDCPDSILQETYYFRWWTFRKHIKQTPEGYVITEFMPDVPWAGKYNAISCPAAFHFYEGRWLHDVKYLSQYANYWFFGGGEPRRYSFWAADALYNFYAVTDQEENMTKMLPALVKNYEAWESSNLDDNGMFWQMDDRDGMEVSICGEGSRGIGYRPTINAYMYGDAIAIMTLATKLGNHRLANIYSQKAQLIKKNLQNNLWDSADSFFKVQPKLQGGNLCTAKELLGYTPWYFNMPDSRFSVAWKYLMDTTCFYAPYGLTTADQSHPDFRISYEGHECQWNGPSWPFATSETLTAMANLLNGYQQNYIDKKDYYKLLSIYAASQQKVNTDGLRVKWIDENLNPYTGDWISRTRLENWDMNGWSAQKGGVERGKDYNHSSFCDLIISGLIGLRPQVGNQLIVAPLVPENTWDYFCLDNIAYHGKILTILYDKNGRKYKKGKGLSVWVNKKKIASAPDLQKLKINLQ